MIYNTIIREIYKDIEEAAKIEGVNKSIIILGLKSGTYKFISHSKLEAMALKGLIDVPMTKIIEYRSIPNITINGKSG